MESIDPVYECDAPLYVDFEQMKRTGGLEDDGADSWFERQKIQDLQDAKDAEMLSEMETDNGEVRTSADAELEVTPRPVREAAQKANDSIHSLLFKRPQFPTLTVPKTPDVLKKYGQKKVSMSKTSEELELDKIKQLRKATEEHLQESRKSFKKLMSNQGSGESQEEEENDKTKERHEDQQRGTKRRRRSSKPLHHIEERINELCKSKKPKCDAYVPVAEQLMKYHKSTPPRFRTTKRPNTPSANRVPHAPRESIKPKTPKLMTKTRSRSLHVESAAEKEEKEVKEIESFQFKAKPFNQKIVTSKGQLGVPKINRKPLTQPMAPTLTVELKAKKSEEEPVRKEFRARPLPKDVLEGVKGLPERRIAEFTNPESPNFALKKRKMEWDSKKKEPTPEPSLKSRPLPPSDQPVFQPELPHRKIEVQPFSFESRYEGKPTRQDIVNQELKKQAELAKDLQFKANPMPSFTPPEVVKPERKVEPQPFQLQSEIRGEKYQNEFKEKVKAQEEQARIAASFKATENTAIYSQPFVPVLPVRPLLEVDNFVLNTEQRSQQRSLYEKEKKEREQLKEKEMAIVRMEQEEEEHKKMLEYRRSLQYHAQPIKHYKPVEVSYGDKELTTPLTPTLITSQRRRSVK